MKRLLSLATTATLLAGAGCTLPSVAHRLGPESVHLNKVVERVHNEILLLNVVRASKRLPRHWSALTTLRDTESAEFGTGGIAVPFGGGAESHKYGAAPSAKASTSPGMDMAVQVSSEFTRGIMQGVDLKQIDYFLKQGWPAEFVFHLLVREIRVEPLEFTGAVCKAEETYRNRPDADAGFSGYGEFVKTLELLVDKGLTVASVSSVPHSDKPGAKPKDSMDSGQGNEVTTRENAKTTRKVEASKSKPALVFPRATAEDLKMLVEMGYSVTPRESGGLEARAKPRPELRLVLSDQRADNASGPGYSVLADLGKGNRRITLALRAPESVIYFLGQILRARGEDPTFVPTFRSNGRRYALFLGRQGSDREASHVSVDHGGQLYMLPAGGELDRTMMTFNLASILINMNRSRDDLPTTSVVTVRG